MWYLVSCWWLGVSSRYSGIIFINSLPKIQKNEKAFQKTATTVEVSSPATFIVRNSTQIVPKTTEDKESVIVAPVVDPIQFAILQKVVTCKCSNN
jgi:hypothetical protein